jgi:calpain-15
LAALAERPDRIYNLFILKEKNELNYYSVKMLYKGKWMTIDMDEYVPFLYNAPAFTKSVENEIWVVLLEKAWAKMYTSYKRIEAGYPE